MVAERWNSVTPSLQTRYRSSIDPVIRTHNKCRLVRSEKDAYPRRFLRFARAPQQDIRTKLAQQNLLGFIDAHVAILRRPRKKTVQQREKELQSLLATPAGKTELYELESRYRETSDRIRPSKASMTDLRLT